MGKQYADVAILNKSHHTDTLFTYATGDLPVRIGSKVRVSFGRGSKLREGYVFRLHDSPSIEPTAIKAIEIVDESVCLGEEIINTCMWLRSRYGARFIDCVDLFLPPKGKYEAEKDDICKTRPSFQKIVKLSDTDVVKEWAVTIEALVRERKNEIVLIKSEEEKHRNVCLAGIVRALKDDRQILYLMPEQQMVREKADYLRQLLENEQVEVFHSALSKKEKLRIWNKVCRNERILLVGTRGSIFLPFQNLGLAIMDREEDAGYRSEQTPKYTGLEVIAKRCMNYNCPLILKSETPSVSTYYRGRTGIFRMFESQSKRESIVESFRENTIPVDMKEELRRGNTHSCSRVVYEGLQNAAKEGKQAIVILNRKGYDKRTEREDRSENRQKIGYVPHINRGTEKVLEEINETLDVRTALLDKSRSKSEIKKIIGDFNKEKIDVIVGTQMILEGLKQDKLKTIALLDIDGEMRGFGSVERAYQLVRKTRHMLCDGGKLYLQTRDENKDIFNLVAFGTYEEIYERVIRLRKMSSYPPFGNVIKISLGTMGKTGDKEVWQVTKRTLDELKKYIEKRFLITGDIPFSEENTSGKFHIIIKCPLEKRREILNNLLRVKDNIMKSEKNKFTFVIDVDSYNP